MNSTPDESTLAQEPPVKMPSLAEAAVEQVFTLDRLMDSARLVERKAVICLRGDLEAEYDQLARELATLVDAEGNVVAIDESLADQKVARANEIQDRMEQLRVEMLAASYSVRFQAMPADEWAAFELEHRDEKGRGEVKDARLYELQLISRCAIEPKLTPAEVEQMRKKLSTPQMDRLFTVAYQACTTGGLDIPKSPLFSLSPKPQE